MKPAICKCCGGQINIERMICEYCGTKYEYDYNENVPKLVYVDRVMGMPKTYKCCVAIPRPFAMDKKFVLAKLARQLADAIINDMDIQTEYNPETMMQQFYAKIRVLENDFRF